MTTGCVVLRIRFLPTTPLFLPLLNECATALKDDSFSAPERTKPSCCKNNGAAMDLFSAERLPR